MRSVGEGVGILVARDVEAGEIAAGVAAIDSAIGEHRRGPAFGAGHLSAGNLLELTGIGLRHDEFALVADNEQFFADGLDRTEAVEAVFLPLHLARGQLNALELGASGVAVETVNMPVDQHAWVEVVSHVFIFPKLPHLVAVHLQ